MDISFKMGDEKFNYRVSAIIISNGRILAMSHGKPSEYYSLPGESDDGGNGRTSNDESVLSMLTFLLYKIEGFILMTFLLL